MSSLLSPPRAWLGVTAQSTAGCHRQQHGRTSASATGLRGVPLRSGLGGLHVLIASTTPLPHNCLSHRFAGS